MGDVSTIGLDTAKRVFQLHGADPTGLAVVRKMLPRDRVLQFLSSQPRCVVALEACGGSHHWGREIAKLGHEVRLTPPKYVKLFVKRQKNDAADAEATCEAAQRQSMRFVAVKSAGAQASASWLARMLARKPRMLVTVALANKMARIAWAVLTTGTVYQAPRATPA